MFRILYSSIYLCFILITVSCNNKANVDLIVKNAKIYSVDSSFSIYESMAISNGKILDIGTNDEINANYNSKDILDLKGKIVYPGFYDAHAHFFGYADNSRRANLKNSKSFEEVLDRLIQHHKNYPNTKWLEGRGWDQNLWEVKEFPNRKKLDSLFPDLPVTIIRVDGHAVMANEAALRKAGIDEDLEIEGGKVIKDENGELTGVLLDKAEEYIYDFIPEASREIKIKSYLEAQQNCLAVGLTSINDAGVSLETMKLCDSLHQSGDFKIKFYLMLQPTPDCFDFAEKNGHYITDRLTVRSFKVYSDGALGSRGACLLKTYSDDPLNHGFLLSPVSDLDSLASKIVNLNYQMNTHAIGDSANRTMLKIYAHYLNGKNDKRWRIEHAQVVNPADRSLFKDYNIIPSVQPTHCTSDMFWADERLGDERIGHAYAYKSLLKTNGYIALGSDFPVEDINPIYGFHAAVARKDADNNPESGFQTEESLSREEALRGMTIWAAMSCFEEDKKGSLEKGKDADFVVFEKDIMKIPEEEIRIQSPLSTYINGEMVYKRQ